MFDAMAEWMTIPLLNQENGNPFKRVGLAHPTIAPYGVFKTRDGADILISIQNDREWRVLADKVLGDAVARHRREIRHQPRSATSTAAKPMARSPTVFAQHDVEPLMQKLAAADIAFARVNDSALLATHPHLRRITVDTPSGPAQPAGAAAAARARSRALRPGSRARRAYRDDQEGIRDG